MPCKLDSQNGESSFDYKSLLAPLLAAFNEFHRKAPSPNVSWMKAQ